MKLLFIKTNIIKTDIGRTCFGRTRLFPAAFALVFVLVLMSQIYLAQFSLAQVSGSAPTQPQARRLILKDGSYQSVTKYEIHGERVRYFSAERGEWEEVPKSLIDWDATAKFEQGRLQEKLAPEAVALDKELEAEQKADLARSPQVAPGLSLPDNGGVFLLDTYQNQPQLSELQQSGGEVRQHATTNVLRAASNTQAVAKQVIEFSGAHAKIQSHTAVPSLYINIDTNNDAGFNGKIPGSPPPLAPAERFKIVRAEVKGGKRIAGSIQTGATGKMKAEEKFVASTVTVMTGGWVKLTPTELLVAGEYAVVEMLGKEGMNLYVWDFGVNPSAPANPSVLKPEPQDVQPKTNQSTDQQKREKH